MDPNGDRKYTGKYTDLQNYCIFSYLERVISHTLCIIFEFKVKKYVLDENLEKNILKVTVMILIIFGYINKK